MRERTNEHENSAYLSNIDDLVAKALIVVDVGGGGDYNDQKIENFSTKDFRTRFVPILFGEQKANPNFFLQTKFDITTYNNNNNNNEIK